MASQATAAVRASVPRDTVDTARRILGERWAAVGDAAFHAQVAELETINRLAWIPVPMFESITESLHQALGDVGYRALIKTQVVDTVASPVFAGMVATYKQMFGGTLLPLLRAYTAGFGILYRGFGRAELLYDEDNHKEFTMVLTDVPEHHLRPTLVLGLAGSLEGILLASQTLGAVGVVPAGPGSVRYQVRAG